MAALGGAGRRRGGGARGGRLAAAGRPGSRWSRPVSPLTAVARPPPGGRRAAYTGRSRRPARTGLDPVAAVRAAAVAASVAAVSRAAGTGGGSPEAADSPAAVSKTAARPRAGHAGAPRRAGHRRAGGLAGGRAAARRRRHGRPARRGDRERRDEEPAGGERRPVHLGRGRGRLAERLRLPARHRRAGDGGRRLQRQRPLPDAGPVPAVRGRRQDPLLHRRRRLRRRRDGRQQRGSHRRSPNGWPLPTPPTMVDDDHRLRPDRSDRPERLDPRAASSALTGPPQIRAASRADAEA